MVGKLVANDVITSLTAKNVKNNVLSKKQINCLTYLKVRK